jgi:choline dehydrogenase-like flavoprotein
MTTGLAPRGPDEYDVCVIGSGASGAVAAWLCARAGLRVVVVEQGVPVTAGMTYDDVLAAAEPAWVRQENGTWGKTGYPWTTCNVGGGTVFFGGAYFRYRPVDFDAERVMGPAELPLAWPWGPEELDPYYRAIEDHVGVSGLADSDPSLPPRGAPYPHPPVARSAEGELMASGARAVGWTPFPTPLAINSASCVADAPCICRRCDVGAKGDALTRFLTPALGQGADLLDGTKAVRLLTRARAATELECVRMATGARVLVRARCYVVCANAVQSAALLLRSAGDRYPAGLGNAHDLVGRGLCFKLSEYLVGYRYRGEDRADAGRPDSGVMGLGPFSTCAVTDLYCHPPAPGGLGGILYEARPERPFHARGDERLVRIEALVPDEPRPANRVRIGTGTDAHGVPDVVLDYQAHPRDLARLEFMLQQGERMLRAAGCAVTVREPSGWALGSGHLHGTCRMGTDPASSVTDPDGRLHDADNIYVADGAVLPFPGGASPTLTIQAVALRTVHRMLARDFCLRQPLSAYLRTM